MTRIPRLLVAVVAIVALATGTAAAATHLDAYSLEGQFICVSCHEPLNQVNSPQAQEEKEALAQLVERGLDRKQINAAMVDYYGVGVLAKPPAHGLNLLVYILPPLALVGGLAFLAYNLPRWRRRARAAAVDERAVERMPLDPADESRLDEELSRFDV